MSHESPHALHPFILRHRACSILPSWGCEVNVLVTKPCIFMSTQLQPPARTCVHPHPTHAQQAVRFLERPPLPLPPSPLTFSVFSLLRVTS